MTGAFILPNIMIKLQMTIGNVLMSNPDYFMSSFCVSIYMFVSVSIFNIYICIVCGCVCDKVDLICLHFIQLCICDLIN